MSTPLNPLQNLYLCTSLSADQEFPDLCIFSVSNTAWHIVGNLITVREKGEEKERRKTKRKKSRAEERREKAEGEWIQKTLEEGLLVSSGS